MFARAGFCAPHPNVLFTKWWIEGMNESRRRDADGCDRDRRHNIRDARCAGRRAPQKFAKDRGSPSEEAIGVVPFGGPGEVEAVEPAAGTWVRDRLQAHVGEP